VRRLHALAWTLLVSRDVIFGGSAQRILTMACATIAALMVGWVIVELEHR